MKLLKRLVKTAGAIVVHPFLKMAIYLRLVVGESMLRGIRNKGEGSFFEGGGTIYSGHKLQIGNHVFLGRNFFIQAAGGVLIGDYTHISRNVTIHTSNHNINGELLPYDREDVRKSVEIGRYVWVGMNVNILPGVKIGDGAVIGMGTTVSKNVPAGAIVVGSGQRVVGQRDPQHTKNLEENSKFLRMKSSSVRKRIVLHGAFQVENFGDTLLLMTYKNFVCSMYQGVEVVASNASAHAAQQASLVRLSPYKMLFSNRDNIVFCGGGYFGERAERKPRWGVNLWVRHLIVGIAAIIKRNSYAIVGTGFGPLSHFWYRVPSVWLVNKAKYVAFRDSESVDYYHRYGGNRDVDVNADAILSMDKEQLLSLVGYEKEDKREGVIIGLHLLGGNDSVLKRKLIFDFFYNFSIENKNVRVILFSDNGVSLRPDSFSWSDDNECHEFRSPKETISILNDCDYVVTTKLHVGICAAILEKKVMAFPLHSKTRRFYKQIGRSDACHDLLVLNEREIIDQLKYFVSDEFAEVKVPDSVVSNARKCQLAVQRFAGEIEE